MCGAFNRGVIPEINRRKLLENGRSNSTPKGAQTNNNTIGWKSLGPGFSFSASPASLFHHTTGEIYLFSTLTQTDLRRVVPVFPIWPPTNSRTQIVYFHNFYAQDRELIAIKHAPTGHRSISLTLTTNPLAAAVGQRD